jgi:hypothetical protein
MEYKRKERISHKVDNEYEIVFDRCTPAINGVLQNDEELLMRYTKNEKQLIMHLLLMKKI